LRFLGRLALALTGRRFRTGRVLEVFRRLVFFPVRRRALDVRVRAFFLGRFAMADIPSQP
jgi:hypothetical protein